MPDLARARLELLRAEQFLIREENPTAHLEVMQALQKAHALLGAGEWPSRPLDFAHYEQNASQALEHLQDTLQALDTASDDAESAQQLQSRLLEVARLL